MRIDQLLQAIEIAKTGSLNKAAQNLFLSQPSLSLSVKRLEAGWICRNQYSPNEAARFFLTRLIEITTGIKPTSLVFDQEP